MPDRTAAHEARFPWPARVVRVCGGYTFLAGILSFSGWALNLPRLTAWFGRDLSMQPNPAVASMAAGLALLLLSTSRRGAMALGLFAAAIGGLTLFEHATGLAVGIDSLLLFGRSWGSTATLAPGRMGPPASLSWTLLGLGLALAATRRPALRHAAPVLGVVALAIASLSLVGYILADRTLTSVPWLTAIALQTATMVLAAAVGLIAATPEFEPVRTLSQPGAAGTLGRRVLPLVILIPIVTGRLRLEAEYAGLLDSALGATLRTVVEIAALAVLLWWAVSMVRRHEQALRASEELNRRIFSSSQDTFTVLDLQGNILSVSPDSPRARDASDDHHAPRRPWPDLWSASEREAARAAVARAAAGSSAPFLGVMDTPAGPRWSEVTVTPMHDADGRPEKLLAVSRDITEHKKARDAVSRSEERLRLATQTGKIGVWEWDIARDRITWTDSLYAIHGLGRDEFRGTLAHLTALVHPEDRDGFAAALARSLEDQQPLELTYRAVRPDGQIVSLFTNAVVARGDGESPRVHGATVDLSDLKRAEQAARAGEQRFRLMADAAPVLVWVSGPDKRVTWINAHWLEFVGRSMAQELGDGWTAGIHPDDRAHCLEGYHTAFDRRRAFSREYRLRRHDGEYRWMLDHGVPRYGPEHDFEGYIGSCIDITERKRAEETHAILAAIVEASDDAMVSKSLDGTIRSWNAGAERLFGYTAAEAVGRSIELIIPPELKAEEQSILRRLSRGERISHYETVRVAKSGALLHVSLTVSPIRDSTGRITGASKVARDITGKKRAEEELLRHREHLELLVKERTEELEASHRQLQIAERMASLGTLAAGLGHDMGNILIPMRVRLDTLDALQLPQDAAEDIRGLRASVEYLRKLATGLRQLAVDPSAGPTREPSEIRAWWAEAETLLRNCLPRSVSLRARLVDGPCWVAMPRAALTQAVFNLVQNAGDAMKQRTGNVEIDMVCEDDRLTLRVIDSGPGMSEEVRRRCMEPFFTTKPRGLSTGLGLAIVYSLVRDSGGTIAVDSSPGKGTVFAITLPLAPTPGPRGPLRRAVVEVADPRMRAYITAELKQLAYDMATPHDNGTPPDLVVVDDRSPRPAGARVIVLGPKPTIREIRAALAAAAGDLPPA